MQAAATADEQTALLQQQQQQQQQFFLQQQYLQQQQQQQQEQLYREQQQQQEAERLARQQAMMVQMQQNIAALPKELLDQVKATMAYLREVNRRKETLQNDMKKLAAQAKPYREALMHFMIAQKIPVIKHQEVQFQLSRPKVAKASQKDVMKVIEQQLGRGYMQQIKKQADDQARQARAEKRQQQQQQTAAGANAGGAGAAGNKVIAGMQLKIIAPKAAPGFEVFEEPTAAEVNAPGEPINGVSPPPMF